VFCNYCGKENERYFSNLNNPTGKEKGHFFCNMDCLAKWKEGQPSIFKGQKHTQETKDKLKSYCGSRASNWRGGITFRKEYGVWKAQKRRSLKVSNGGFHTIEEWEKCKKRYNYTCPMCGVSEPEIKLTLDHIIPLSCGGKNSIENIQPLCRACNSSKGTAILKFNRLRQQEMVFNA